MFLLALLIVFVLTGVFASQNGGTQSFTLLGYSWVEPIWLPTAIGVGIVSALFVLHMGSADIGYRFRRLGHDRQIEGHRDLIADLRDENSRLREELAAARGRPVSRTPAQSWVDGLRSQARRMAGR
ncbi:MAG TPA: hypothetical protein VKF14_04245 [Candidatus Dormibacteraeota bacterium]|nr:hypothetical protein [Candidatus Dormibacteraeota bacterium]